MFEEIVLVISIFFLNTSTIFSQRSEQFLKQNTISMENFPLFPRITQNFGPLQTIYIPLHIMIALST